MGFACQQMGFVLCLSYPCWRTVPRGSGGRGRRVSAPIYKSINHRHCHRGKVREADTCTTPDVRMSLLISYRQHTQKWMLYLSVFVLGTPCDKSLPSIPGLSKLVHLRPDMFKLLRLGTPPGPIHTCLYKFVYRVARRSMCKRQLAFDLKACLLSMIFLLTTCISW